MDCLLLGVLRFCGNWLELGIFQLSISVTLHPWLKPKLRSAKLSWLDIRPCRHWRIRRKLGNSEDLEHKLEHFVEIFESPKPLVFEAILKPFGSRFQWVSSHLDRSEFLGESRGHGWIDGGCFQGWLRRRRPWQSRSPMHRKSSKNSGQFYKPHRNIAHTSSSSFCQKRETKPMT